MKQPRVIDLNADMGESPEALAAGADAELMRYISSANVACGAHAGDERTVRETLQLAKSFGVAVGAHPSYPDRESFGRAEMKIDPRALELLLLEQILWLSGIAAEVGIPVGHVKPHGALYHAMSKRSEIAAVVASVIRAIDPKLFVVAQAGSAALKQFREMGLAVAGEAFADRAYEADGSLRDRKLPGALLQPAERAAEQAVEIVTHARVKTLEGGTLPVKAETLCVHSDTPGAANIAAQIRTALAARGIQVRAFTAAAGLNSLGFMPSTDSSGSRL